MAPAADVPTENDNDFELLTWLVILNPAPMKRTPDKPANTSGAASNAKIRPGVSSSLPESIESLAATVQILNERAVGEYAPIVESILRSRSRDVRHIENTLDGLLDFCGHVPVLHLYKRLCRHYFEIDAAATAEYVHAYRRMWGSEGEEQHS